jgi:surface polysaccharide O-acyltransferase-like enzyme
LEDVVVMVNADIRNRIDALRFPLIVGVVFIHNSTTTVSMANGSIGTQHTGAATDFVINLISQGIARLAVPLFFAISGYLFFQGEWSTRLYVDKLRRRSRTLLLPFVLWNAGTLMLYALVQSLPQTRAYVSYSVWPPIRSLSLFGYLNALIGITGFPILPPFWFLRDLMVLVVVAPLFHFLLVRRVGLGLLVVLGVLWGLEYWPLLWPTSEATLFFCIGSAIAIHSTDLAALDRFAVPLAWLTLVSLLIDAWFAGQLLFVHKAMILFGVCTSWWLAGVAVRRPQVRSTLLVLSGYSFFVFAAHQPILLVLRKIAFKLASPLTDARILLLYFLIPIVLIAFLVMIYRLFSRFFPSLAGLLTGREVRQAKLAA